MSNAGGRLEEETPAVAVWKVGDQAVLIDDAAAAERKFVASGYVWTAEMSDMLGKTFPVLSVSHGIVGLPSPDGSGEVCYFPDTVVVKSTLAQEVPAVAVAEEGDGDASVKTVADAPLEASTTLEKTLDVPGIWMPEPPVASAADAAPASAAFTDDTETGAADAPKGGEVALDVYLADVDAETLAPGASGSGGDGAPSIAPPLPPPAHNPEDEEPAEPLCPWIHRLYDRLPRVPELPECPGCPTCCSFDIWGAIHQAPTKYLENLANYPLAFLAGYVVLFMILIIPLWRPVVINTDLDTFNQVDSATSANFTVYRDALKHMRAVKNASSLGDRTSFQLEIVYQAKNNALADDVDNFGEGSVFDEASLRDIRKFEHELRNMPVWQEICQSSDARARFRCEPGESLGNYIWPERMEDDLDQQGYFKLGFDGLAREQMPVQATLTYLFDAAISPTKFLPQAFTGPKVRSSLLRSLFTFTAPQLDDTAFREKYQAFIADLLYPALQLAAQKAKEVVQSDTWDEPSHVLIYYRGDLLDEHEVRSILESDMYYAVASLFFMAAILWVQLRSLFLAFVGMCIIMMSTLLSYVLVQVETLSIVSFLSVFLVLSLGSNVLIVVNDLFHRSRRAHPDKDEYIERLFACYKATMMWLMPVLFTAATFFVHLVSDMRPMREFGVFTGTMMLVNAFLSLAVFVPALIVHEDYVRRFLYQKLPRKVAVVLEPAKLRPPWKQVTVVFIKCAKKEKNVLIGAAAVAVICFVCAITTAALRPSEIGLPEVFPPDHQRTAGRPSMGAFTPTSPAETAFPNGTTVCEPGRAPESTRDGRSTCGLHWCEAPMEGPNRTVVDDRTQCSCYKKMSSPVLCQTADITTAIAGTGLSATSSGGSAELVRAVSAMIESEYGAWNIDSLNIVRSAAKRLPSLVLENWESGLTNIDSFIEAPSVRVTRKTGADRICNDQFLCYCGNRQCQVPLGTSFVAADASISLNMTAVSTASGRRLSDAINLPVASSSSVDVESNARYGDSGRRLSLVTASDAVSAAEVYIMFGILPPETMKFFDGAPTWTYDPKFDPTSPWAQRAMLSICEGPDGVLPSNLLVTGKECWIEDFKIWRLSQGLKFPTERFEDFNGELARFMQEHESASSYMWLNEEGKMRATTLHMRVNLGKSSWDALNTQEAWLEYIHLQNDKAHSTADKAWPTSQAWVDAEAYYEAVWSAWSIAGLAVCAVIVSGLVYTQDMTIVSIVAGISVLVCIALSFIIFCIFQWRTGPWEIIILTVFLSFSVEPALRLAHDFVRPNADFGIPTNPPDNPREEDDGVPADNLLEQFEVQEPASPPVGGTIISDDAIGPEDSIEKVKVLQGPPGVMQPPGCEEMGGLALASTSAPAEGAIVVADENAAAIVPVNYADDISSHGSSGPDKEIEDLREARVTRSVYLVNESTLSGGIKLILSGLFLLPCQFRIFSRLGAVAVVVPMVSIPCTLIVLPAVLVKFMPIRKDPDCIMCSSFLYDKARWMWT